VLKFDHTPKKKKKKKKRKKKKKVEGQGYGCGAVDGRPHNMSALGRHIFLLIIMLDRICYVCLPVCVL